MTEAHGNPEVRRFHPCRCYRGLVSDGAWGTAISAASARGNGPWFALQMPEDDKLRRVQTLRTWVIDMHLGGPFVTCASV